MEVATVANGIAVSGEIEMTDAAGSESDNNNNKEENVASNSTTSNYQEKNFKLLDSLYFDAADGDIKVFQEQYSKQLDQILTPNGNTILHIYITARPRRVGDQEREADDFVREILKMCPDLLWKANNKGETLLHMAARHGHADVTKFLLDECKKPNQNHDQEVGIKTTSQMLQMKNEAKDTALHEAVRYNYLDVVQLLTNEDPTLPYDVNTAGETPLYLAAERGHVEVVEEILGTCDAPDDRGPCNRTALHAAVIHKYEGVIRLLLKDRRIHKSEQDENGWTPLHFAAHLGYVFVVKKLLIEDEHAVYKADNEGKTALHVAASCGKVNIMKKIMYSCPGCCELVDKRGWNVLHFASTFKNQKAVRFLLRFSSLGNLINEKDEDGNTPFLQAISKQVVIDHPKVDTMVFNNRNHNAFDVSRGNPTCFNPPEFVRWQRIRQKVYRGRRIVPKDKDKEGEEDKSNPVSSERNNGNGKTSKDSSREDVIKTKRQNELVAATLIATVTFAAGLTVPGGVISEKGPEQGTAILTKNKAFKAFVILNSISMFLSCLAVFNHQSRWPYRVRKTNTMKMRLGDLLINYAMWAMIGAFLSGTCAVLYRDIHLAISACVVPVAFFAYLLLANKKEIMLRKYLILFQPKRKIVIRRRARSG